MNPLKIDKYRNLVNINKHPKKEYTTKSYYNSFIM